MRTHAARFRTIVFFVGLVFVALVAVVLASVASAGELPAQAAIRAARDEVFPALVHVQAVSEGFKDGRRVQTVSVGSGVIVDKRGHVVTNYHVVGRASKLICTLSSKQQVRAARIGGDPWTDLAVIRIDLRPLKGKRVHFARFAEPGSLEAGDYVLAMGSPLSLSRSLSMGIVSCADRYLPGGTKLPTGEPTGLFNTWIQTDAAINPGNSGGPLVNLDGRIVGINSRGVRLASNIGFAIPVSVVQEVVAQLIKRRRVVRGWLGVRLQPLRGVGGAADQTAERGVVVASVEEGSPGAEAGLRPGDVLLKLGNEAVDAPFIEDVPRVYRAIAALRPGKPTTIEFRRNGDAKTATLKVAALGAARAAERHLADLGLVVRDITTEDVRAQNLADRHGAMVASVAKGGLAGAAGLRAGDIIVEFARQPVGSVKKLTTVYRKLPRKKRNRILVKYRRGMSAKLALIQRGK
jgi:serine protease Do